MRAYRYGLARRPMQMGAQPAGHLPVKNATHLTPNYDKPNSRFGHVYYDHELSEAAVANFELVPAGEAELFKLNDYEMLETDPAYMTN